MHIGKGQFVKGSHEHRMLSIKYACRSLLRRGCSVSVRLTCKAILYNIIFYFCSPVNLTPHQHLLRICFQQIFCVVFKYAIHALLVYFYTINSIFERMFKVADPFYQSLMDILSYYQHLMNMCFLLIILYRYYKFNQVIDRYQLQQLNCIIRVYYKAHLSIFTH